MNTLIADSGDLLKQQVIAKFWPVAALVLIVFIPLDFFVLKDYLIGSIHIIDLIFVVIALPLYIKAEKVVVASNILAVCGMLAILPWIFTGGPAHNGFWWSIVYVVGVFLVTGKRWAFLWLTIYFVISLLITVLSLQGFVKIAYSIPELLSLLFAFFITLAFVYFFNEVREYYAELSKTREQELDRLNRELIAVNKDLEQFAYVASHDLQEPLRTISNFVGLMEEKFKGKTDKDTEQYMEFVTGASSKMQTLIKDLLNLSRIGRNITFTDVDCNDVLKDVIAEMDATIKESNAKITYAFLPVLKANKTELKRLFQNLISNAIKFRKKDVISQIVITVKQKKMEYIFAVSDNGIGIEEQSINKIFIIFQRLHDNTEYPGTGIGLAICKKIVALHGGRIWIKSTLGEGSTFYFSISKQI